ARCRGHASAGPAVSQLARSALQPWLPRAPRARAAHPSNGKPSLAAPIRLSSDSLGYPFSMRRSLPRLTVLCCVVALGACAIWKAPEPPQLPLKPVYAGRSATLEVTNDIDIVGAASMPSGFEPN